VLVGVDTGVDDIVKQVIHDVSETLGSQHSMKSSDKHCLLWIQSLRRLLHVVAVTQHPRYHLYLYRRRINELCACIA